MTFANGMLLAFIFGLFNSAVVSPVAGPQIVGFVVAAFALSNSVTSKLWPEAIARFKIQKTHLLLGITATLLSFIVGLMCLMSFGALPINYMFKDGAWTAMHPSTPLQILCLLSAAVLLGVTDSVYESQIPALVQAYFQGNFEIFFWK